MRVDIVQCDRFPHVPVALAIVAQGLELESLLAVQRLVSKRRTLRSHRPPEEGSHLRFGELDCIQFHTGSGATVEGSSGSRRSVRLSGSDPRLR